MESTSTLVVVPIESVPVIEAMGLAPRAFASSVSSLRSICWAFISATEIPRVGFTLETIFVPFGETDTHPFSGATAADAGRASFRDNGIEIELELNLMIPEAEQTGGWVESHFDILDKIRPGETPDAGSVYTHKLNFELDTAFLPFSRLSEDNWLHHLEVEGSLDYVATGLPKAGDVVGGERYLDNASAWSFSLVGVIPLAPLAP